MDYNQIINEVNQIFKNVLDEENTQLQYSSTANDVEGWDSLTHIQLVVAIEKYFKIRFTSLEIQGFKNVGEMCEGILKKIPQ